jgi:crotonobetainyl-CoA:carnitine CoA-transferase CaiB-like acyl-CoA transferase
MSEEQTAPVEQAVDTSSLQAELEAMRKKNAELLDEYKKAVKQAKAIPDGVDIEELIQFKRQAEQQELESQGKYSEARQALEQQFREATAEKDKRIAELEARVRELEVLSPAVTALADVVHDPDMILRTQVLKEQIEREADGTVVVVKGYERTPIGEWAKTLPAWMQKQPKPQGSGAPIGRSTGEVPTGVKNPFSPESFNLTEQSRLYKTDRDLYEKLKAAAAR